YKVEATYKAPAGFRNVNPGTEIRDWPFWAGELKSNAITIEVKPEPAGKEVHGVQARLRPEKEKWKAGESPRFAFELTNEGKRAWAGVPTDQGCLIEVDGTWYENESGRAAPR